MSYLEYLELFQIPQRYRFSSKSQLDKGESRKQIVVLDTTKVQIFKQITTLSITLRIRPALFQIPQRYRFSSKSQQGVVLYRLPGSCFRYHKGTDFQANHNFLIQCQRTRRVVLDTTKVQIFKQITTVWHKVATSKELFQIPQRYRFSSKSQQLVLGYTGDQSCFRYHKGTDFQANHNPGKK